MSTLPCPSAAVSHGCLGQEGTKEDLSSPQNQIKPRPLLQCSGRILSVPPVRPQFSVAVPPSCGRERNSTWRGKQTPGAGRNSPQRPQKGEETKGTKDSTRVTLFIFSYCFTFPFYLPNPGFPCRLPSINSFSNTLQFTRCFTNILCDLFSSPFYITLLPLPE